MADIADILKRARPRESTVTVCLAGDLAAEVERLEALLARTRQDAWKAESLASADPGTETAQRIADLQSQMADSEVTFTLRALGHRAWSDLMAAHPSEATDQAFDPVSFTPALIAACCVDPEMTVDQVGELFDVLSTGQVKGLIDAAFEVNSEPTAVPFSLAASAILASRTAGK